MLQARRLGKELFVGIHSDQAILENKGPTVMALDERYVFALRSISPKFPPIFYIKLLTRIRF